MPFELFQSKIAFGASIAQIRPLAGVSSYMNCQIIFVGCGETPSNVTFIVTIGTALFMIFFVNSLWAIATTPQTMEHEYILMRCHVFFEVLQNRQTFRATIALMWFVASVS